MSLVVRASFADDEVSIGSTLSRHRCREKSSQRNVIVEPLKAICKQRNERTLSDIPCRPGFVCSSAFDLTEALLYRYIRSVLSTGTWHRDGSLGLR